MCEPKCPEIHRPKRRLEQRIGQLVEAKRSAGEMGLHGGDRSKVEGSTLLSIGLSKQDAGEMGVHGGDRSKSQGWDLLKTVTDIVE